MMYNNKLATAIKTGGKVLREFGDIVYLPFGSEYSIFLKNLNNVRASVSITIDSEDIADGQQFVVRPNDSLEIERFLRNDNLAEGNRFKFIERTSGIEQHRGIGVEDGLLRVEYKFEKPVRKRQNILRHVNTSLIGSNNLKGNCSYNTTKGEAVYSAAPAAGAVHDGEATLDFMESGITTEGSISDQSFQQIASFPLEAQSHVIVLKLMGETENNRHVTVPVTTRSKPECNKCGTMAPAYNAQFCSDCGTSLQLMG